MASLIKLSANEILLREGEHSNNIYWLQAGKLVAIKSSGLEECFAPYQ